jgi:hypothetical protein
VRKRATKHLVTLLAQNQKKSTTTNKKERENSNTNLGTTL